MEARAAARKPVTRFLPKWRWLQLAGDAAVNGGGGGASTALFLRIGFKKFDETSSEGGELP